MPQQKTKKNVEEPKKSQEEIEFEKLSKFFDKYISNKKLTVKYAVLLGIERVMYVKGKDFKNFFAENFSEIQKEILEITKIDLGEKPTTGALQLFYEINQKRTIMHYLQREPGDKAKYPKRLVPLKKTDDIKNELIFSDTGFYSLLIKIEKSNKPIIYLILLVLLILFIVLFPIWPLNVKLGVLWGLIGILIFLILFLVLSIVVAIVGVIFGYDIYIMPNIDEAKMTWYDRLFNPFVAYNAREDPLSFKILRIFTGVSIVILCAIAYFYPTIPRECYDLFKRGIEITYNFINKKIIDIHNGKGGITVKDKKYYEDFDNL